MKVKDSQTRKWLLLASPVRGGQRFFHLADDDDNPPNHEIFLCDESGVNPDHTDDGPLRLDLSRTMDVCQCEKTRTCRYSAPVISTRSGRKSRVPLDRHEAAVLAELVPDLKVNWPEEVANDLRVLLCRTLELGCDECSHRGWVIMNEDEDGKPLGEVQACDCCSPHVSDELAMARAVLVGYSFHARDGHFIVAARPGEKEPAVLPCDHCGRLELTERMVAIVHPKHLNQHYCLACYDGVKTPSIVP